MSGQTSRYTTWAAKVAALIQGGNAAAAMAQIKVAPSVKDLQQLQKMLGTAPGKPQAHVTAVIEEQIAALSAPRLHRSP